MNAPGVKGEWRQRLWPAIRTLGLIGTLLIGAALLAVGAVVLVLRTDAATQWALTQAQQALPELKIRGARGNLIDGLHVDELRYEDPDLELIIAPLDLRLSWANLLRARATLDPLRIGRLTIHPRGPADDEPVTLPTLISPVALHVPRLTIAELVIQSGDSITMLHDIDTGVRWLGAALRLEAPRLAYEQFTLIAERGRIAFTGDYPLALKGVITSPDLPGPVTATAGGTLRALTLDASLAGAWPATASATLHTLDTDLPFTLRARLAAAVERNLGVDRLTIKSAELDAAGTLEHFDGKLAAQLHDQRYGDSALSGTLALAGETLAAKATLALPRGAVRSDCTLAFDTENWQCRGDIDALPLTPWLNGLDAEVSTPFEVSGRLAAPFDLRVALADIRGRLDQLALTGALRAESPDLAHWQIPEMRLVAGANRLAASGALGDDSRLQVELDAPQLAQLYAGLGGSARASLDVTGALAAPSVRGTVQVRDLRYGETRVRSAQARLALAELGRRPGELVVAVAGLETGGTQLAIDASWRGTRADHGWQINVAEARATANLTCRGALIDNDERYRLECASLRGTFKTGQRNTRTDAMASENAPPESENAGRRNAGTPAVVPWSLRAPLLGRWDFSHKEGGIDAFCIDAAPASLCAKPGLQYRGGQLQAFDASLSQLPLRWWRRGLPQELRLRNDPHLNAALTFVKQQPLQLRAKATLEASEWRWTEGEERQTLRLDPVTASADLDPREARLALALRAPEYGSASAALTVADPLQAKRLTGRVEVNALQLAAFGWAIPDVEAVSGRIDGAVTIAGTAAQPLIAGQFALAEARVDMAGVDPIEKLRADLHFDNLRADLEGTFQVGGGGAQLLGDMTWDTSYQNWRAQLHLRGDHLKIEPIAGSTLVFGPDLTLSAVPGDLQLRGEMLVERADIHIQQLPPETVNPSRDVVVSGREANDTTLPLTLDVALNLGKDIHFTGFGAEVDLAGQLQLQQEKNRELAATGRVNVTKGRYRAYGQRLIVRKGQFIFTGNLDNPDLNLEAIREMTPGNTDVVGLRVTGSLRDPVAQLFSEQSLSESDIAYYLLTGRKRDPNQQGGGFTAGGTLLSLGLSRSEDQAAKLAEKFGIRGLQLGTAAGNDGSTEAEVSGYLFRDLYVRYGRSLGENADSVTLQYQLSPNLMIQSISGIEEVLELIYTFTID